MGGVDYSALLRALTQPVRRRVFISYCHLDQADAAAFARWAGGTNVFTARALGMAYGSDVINSTNPEYVMRQIRQKHLGDSSVTIVLVGKCTHSRRYVDWEIKASLQQGAGLPNGLMAILLPSAYNGRTYPIVPERFKLNYRFNDANCYARYYYYPASPDQLREWVEDAYKARTARASLIENPNEMMKYNIRCKACNVTH